MGAVWRHPQHGPGGPRAFREYTVLPGLDHTFPEYVSAPPPRTGPSVLPQATLHAQSLPVPQAKRWEAGDG